MKKFLSLVLALVMAMSLVTISAGAKDFTDNSSITYGEAVDVMSGVGVIDGYTTGDFKPTDTLTRGAAAKIICNMILGPTTAGALSADTAPFKDVPANHVFAGYIAYCAQQGIINGYNDGTFKPSGTVTGYQFLKMLLGALGYDGSIEGFTGGNWTVNVAKLASSLGLMKGNDNFVGTNAMTREEACLYAFNTMQTTMVEYENNFVIVGSDGKVTQGVSSAKEVANNTTSANTIKKDGKMQFAERYFKDLKLTAGTDAFERPANIWNYKTTNIGTYAKTADASYTEEVKLGTIYSDLGLSKTVAAADVEFHVDGKVESASGNANDNSTALTTLGLVKGSSDKIGGAGVLTQVYYDTDNGTAVITMVNTYAGEVKGVHAATSSRDAYINVSPIAAGVGAAGTYDTNESFSVDDVVLYTYSNKVGDTGIQSVVSAETVTGTLNGFTAQKNVTVNGTSYGAAKVYSTKVTGLENSVGYEVELVLDQYGYVLNVNTDKASGNYAVVLDAGKSGFDNMARLLFTDGTVKDVVLKDTTIGAFDDDATGLTVGDIVSYKVNSESKYTLTLLADGYNSATSGNIVAKGSATVLDNADFANLYAGSNRDEVTSFNGKTIFLVKDSNGNYTSYTGFANVPTITVSAAVPMAIYAKTVSGSPTKTGVATVVYIDASQNATSTSSSKDVVFVKGSSVGASYDATKGTYYTYTAVVNGELTTIDTVTQTTADTLYSTVSYDKNNVATLSNGVNASDKDYGTQPTVNGALYSDGTTYKVGTKAESNGVIGVLGGYYTYAKDCTVFYKDTDGNITASSVSAITDDSNDIVFVKFVDSEITSIVIVQVAEGGGNSGNNTGYVVNTPATVALTSAGASVTNAKVFYNGSAPTGDIENLNMKVTYYSWATADGAWKEYTSESSADAKITGSTGVVDDGTLGGATLAVGNYKVVVTLSGSNIGTLTLFDGTASVTAP